MKKSIFLSLVLFATAAPSFGGEIIFNNGDKLTGKVTEMGGGKLKVSGTVAGDIVADLKDVKTFSTDDQMTIRMHDNSVVHEKVSIPIKATKRLACMADPPATA